MRTGSRRHRISSVFQILGRRAGSLRIGLYTNFLDTTASVFVMRGPSYRGRGLDTYSVEAVPQAVKVRGIQPEGM